MPLVDVTPVGVSGDGTEVLPNAPFTVYKGVAPGGVALRDRLAWQGKEEYELGEQLFAEDAAVASKGRVVGENYDGLLDNFIGMAAGLNKSDSEAAADAKALNVSKGNVSDASVATDARALSVSRSASDIQSLTESYWNVDQEGNVSDAATPSDASVQSRSKALSDTEAATAAATGVTGYGRFGYGQGGYGGTISLTG